MENMTWLLSVYVHNKALVQSSNRYGTSRFFERIAKTYRREQWSTMLGPLLRKWYACAQQLGDVELSIKLLVELLISGQGLLFLS